MRLDFETAWDAELMDARATVTLIAVAVGLSVQFLQGYDLEFLLSDWRTMPEASWTWFTSCLLHGGWLHLAFNVYWVYQLGLRVEAMLGLWPYVLLVVALAVVPSAAQWAISGPSLGLSGIVYGLFGVLFALNRWHPRCRGVLNKDLTLLFGLWFLFCLAATWMRTMPIANTAHGAGFVLGALIGWCLSPLPRRARWSWTVPAGVAALTGVLVLPPVRHVINWSDAYAFELCERGLEAALANDEGESQRLFEEALARFEAGPGSWELLRSAYEELDELDAEDGPRDARRRALQLQDGSDD